MIAHSVGWRNKIEPLGEDNFLLNPYSGPKAKIPEFEETIHCLFGFNA
jgi:hypothetical protein